MLQLYIFSVPFIKIFSSVIKTVGADRQIYLPCIASFLISKIEILVVPLLLGDFEN